MLPELPSLAILPLETLIPHEHHDHQRSLPLINKLRSSGVLRNPPIVTPLRDRSARQMVLDGANRVSAFQEMAIPHILVQIVQPDDPQLGLNTWNHVTWNLDSQRLLEGIGQIENLVLEPGLPEKAEGELMAGRALALIHLPPDRLYLARSPAKKITERVDYLNKIVDTYRTHATMDRTNLRSIEVLKTVYPRLSGLLIFPHFTVDQVSYLAGSGHLLPSGITRFTVTPRVLHLNYPLKELEADKPLKKKNYLLQRWIKDRLANKGVRYYAEATFLFDE